MTAWALANRTPRQLLDRLLDAPNLAQRVRSLEPRVLHQLVRRCGLEDLGEIMALATTAQLARLFDDDLWQGKPGEPERFDADRFGVWLEVLAGVGPSVAAGKLVEMDLDFVTGAFSQQIVVLDEEAMLLARAADEMDVDGERPAGDALMEALANNPSYEFNGYVVVARRGGSWDAVLSVLVSLDHEHPAFFGTLLRRCCQISTEHIEDNGGLYEVLMSGEQALTDMAASREERREGEGYVPASQATAFLKLARERHDGGPDPLTAAYFRSLGNREGGSPRGERTERRETRALGVDAPEPARRALPGGSAGHEDRLSRIRAQLLLVEERDHAAHSHRTAELAYLANVLVSGCALQSRRFRAAEAANAALAVCNLGLENWGSDAGRTVPPDLLLRQDLVAVFREGWRVLHEQVCLFTARRLVDALDGLACDDRDVQGEITALSRRMKVEIEAGTPWRACDELDVVATLDLPSWWILLGLVAECPVVPKDTGAMAGRRPLRVASEFEFVSENRQVASARAFALSLPESLDDVRANGRRPSV